MRRHKRESAAAEGRDGDLLAAKERYKAGTRVVVQDQEANWVEKTLIGDSEVEEGELRLTFGTGPDESVLFELKNLPDIVAFNDGYYIEDTKNAKQYAIENPTVTDKGHVQFDVRLENGKVVAGVPQEFLQSWDRTLKLEEKLTTVKKDLEQLAEDKRNILKGKVKTLEDQIKRLIGSLPELTVAPSQKRIAIERAKARLEALHTAAEEALSRLERELAIDVRSAEADRAEKGRKPVFHTETTAEKAERQAREEAEHNARKAAVTQLEIDLNKEIKNGQASKKKTNGGDLTPDEASDIDLDVRKEYLKKLLKNPIFAEEFKRRRIERAVNEPLQDDVAKSGTNKGDYENPDRREKLNLELLDKIITDWKADYTPKEIAPPEGRDVVRFDFDSELKEAVDKLNEYLNKVNTDEQVKIHPDAGALQNEIIELKKIIEEAGKNLSTVDGAVAASIRNVVVAVNDKKAALHKVRLEIIKNCKDRLEEFRLRLEGIMAPPSADGDETYEPTQERVIVDIHGDLMKLVLENNRASVKDAMKLLYEGADKKTVELAFRNIITDEDQSSSVMPVLLLELRECGINNWAEFKKLWDNSLASEVMATMEQAAKLTLQRKLSEQMEEWEGILDQLKINKGQIAARAGITMLLVGGTAIGIRELVGLAENYVEEVSRVAAAAVAGAAVGAVKWKIGQKKQWGNSEKIQARTKELRENSLKNIAKQMWEDGFGSVPERAVQGADRMDERKSEGRWFEKIPGLRGIFNRDEREQRKEVVNTGMYGMRMCAESIAQAIRLHTAGKLEIGSGDEKVTLTGNERIIFEQALARLESHNLDEKQTLELARVISTMSGNGSMRAKQLLRDNKLTQGSPAEDFLKFYAGRGNLKHAIGYNIALSEAFAALPGVAAVFGTFVGAHLGGKIAEKMWMKEERLQAEERVIERLQHVRQKIIEARRQPRSTSFDVDAFKNEIMDLKRILHGTAAPEDMLAVMYFTKGEVDDSGKPRPRINGLLLDQIRAVVHDAEKVDVLFKNEKADRAKLEKVLQTMRTAGTEAEQQQTQSAESRKRQKSYKRKGLLIGAIGGGVAYAAGGWLAHRIVGGAIATGKYVGHQFGEAYKGLTLEHDTSPIHAPVHQNHADHIAASQAELEAAKNHTGELPEQNGFRVKIPGDLDKDAELVTSKGPLAAVHKLENFMKGHNASWTRGDIIRAMEENGYHPLKGGGWYHPGMEMKGGVKLVPFIDENGNGHFSMVDMKGGAGFDESHGWIERPGHGLRAGGVEFAAKSSSTEAGARLEATHVQVGDEHATPAEINIGGKTHYTLPVNADSDYSVLFSPGGSRVGYIDAGSIQHWTKPPGGWPAGMPESIKGAVSAIKENSLRGTAGGSRMELGNAPTRVSGGGSGGASSMGGEAAGMTATNKATVMADSTRAPSSGGGGTTNEAPVATSGDEVAVSNLPKKAGRSVDWEKTEASTKIKVYTPDEIKDIANRLKGETKVVAAPVPDVLPQQVEIQKTVTIFNDAWREYAVGDEEKLVGDSAGIAKSVLTKIENLIYNNPQYATQIKEILGDNPGSQEFGNLLGFYEQVAVPLSPNEELSLFGMQAVENHPGIYVKFDLKDANGLVVGEAWGARQDEIPNALNIKYQDDTEMFMSKDPKTGEFAGVSFDKKHGTVVVRPPTS